MRLSGDVKHLLVAMLEEEEIKQLFKTSPHQPNHLIRTEQTWLLIQGLCCSPEPAILKIWA